MEKLDLTTIKKHIFLSRFLLLLALFLCAGSSAVAQKGGLINVLIHVQGEMAAGRENGKVKYVPVPVPGIEFVNVTYNDGQVYRSDINGRVQAQLYGDVTLEFRGNETFKGQKVKIKNRKEFTVTLELTDIFKKAQNLDQVTKTETLDDGLPKVINAKAEGNWIPISLDGLHPKSSYMMTDNRMVVQPVAKRLVGNVESGWKDFEEKEGVSLTYMTPLVVDRPEYDVTQNRMYDFDMSRDALATGIRIVAADSLRQGKWIEMEDSVRGKYRKERETRLWNVNAGKSYYYANDLRDNYVFYLLMAYEDYHKVLRVDTAIRSVGVSRPWRWLEYNFASRSIPEGKAGYPEEPNNDLQEKKGTVNVFFENGKSNLNLEDSMNLAEVAKMKRDIDLILNQKDARLMGVTFIGQSSPEGGYATNIRLANERLASLRTYFRGQVGEKGNGVRWGASDQAVVATWEQVADALEEDSLKSEAEAIRAVCARTSGIDAQTRQIRGLDFYNTLLKEKYLPRFRTTFYKLDYAIYGKKTLEEVRTTYQNEGIRALHSYYALQLISNEPDTLKRIDMLRDLLKDESRSEDRFFWANELQCLLISRNEPELDLLAPYVKRKLWGGNPVLGIPGREMPAEVFYNHVVALLHHTRFSDAATLLSSRVMPKEGNTGTLEVFVKVLAGDTEARDHNLDVIANTSPRNKVITLLMKDKKEATEEALELCTTTLSPSDPITYYLEAVCHNKLNDEEKADEALQKAIKKRPDLEQAACYDGDLSQLPRFKEIWEPLFMTPEEIAERERKIEAEFMKFVEAVDLSLTFEDVIRIDKEEKAAAEAKKKAEQEAAEAAEKAMQEKAAQKEQKKKGRKSKKSKDADAELPAAGTETEVKAEGEVNVEAVATDSVSAPAAEPAKKEKKSKKSKKSKKEEQPEEVKAEPEAAPGTPEGTAEPAKEPDEQKQEEPVAKEEEKTETETPAGEETPETAPETPAEQETPETTPDEQKQDEPVAEEEKAEPETPAQEDAPEAENPDTKDSENEDTDTENNDTEE